MDSDIEQHAELLRASDDNEAKQQAPDLQLPVPQERNISDLDLDHFTSGLDFMTDEHTFSRSQTKLHFAPRVEKPVISFD